MATREFDARSAELLHQSITKALKFGGMLAHFPDMIDEAIRHESWKFRYCREKGRSFNSLLEYLEHHEPDGCQVPRSKVEALIKDKPEILAKWRKATVGKRGGDRGNQHTGGKRDNITNASPDAPDPSEGRGTSRAYTLSRLEQKDPVLFQKVCAGEMSANKAAIQAGIRKKPSVFEQVCRLLPKLTPDERAEIYRLLETQVSDRRLRERRKGNAK